MAEGEEGAAAPSSLAFRQLEKQNARLKDALIRCVLAKLSHCPLY